MLRRRRMWIERSPWLRLPTSSRVRIAFVTRASAMPKVVQFQRVPPLGVTQRRRSRSARNRAVLPRRRTAMGTTSQASTFCVDRRLMTGQAGRVGILIAAAVSPALTLPAPPAANRGIAPRNTEAELAR